MLSLLSSSCHATCRRCLVVSPKRFIVKTRNNNTNILILILMTMFMVLSSWRGHCESSPGSFDECRLSARWPPTLKPSQTTWLVSPPVGCYHPHPPSPFISITQSESCYPFYRLTFDDTRNAYAKIEYVKIPAHLKNRIRV